MHRSGTTRPTRLLAVVALGGAMTAAGCNNAGQGAVSGAAAGALAGLAIGSVTGASGTGAAIGAVSGAAAGAVIGDVNRRNDERHYEERRDQQRRYDDREYHEYPYGDHDHLGYHEHRRSDCCPDYRHDRLRGRRHHCRY